MTLDTDSKSLPISSHQGHCTFISFCPLLDACVVEVSPERTLHKLSCLLSLDMKKHSLYICIGTEVAKVFLFPYFIMSSLHDLWKNSP